MNKDIKELIYLLNESLFDNDELFDLDSIPVHDNEIVLNTYKADIYQVILPILGTDKPRAWKKIKDENNEYILFYEGDQLGKTVQNVLDKLKENGFKEYVNSRFRVPIIFKFDDLKKWEKSKDFPKYTYEKYWRTNTRKFRDDDYEQYKKDYQRLLTYPEYVKNLFYKFDNCSRVYLSPDQGIACILKDKHYTLEDLSQPYWISSDPQTIIKLTGEVFYTDEGYEKNTTEKLKYKDIKKRIDMLKVPYNKIHDNTFKIFNLNADGYPYSIKYFNWNSEISKMPKSLSKLNIPRIIYDLFKHKGFQPVQQFDKEDDKSEIELLNNCLSIKVYKNIKTKDMPKGTDSCLIIELTGYLKDHYTNLYLNDKK